ncbi:MAG: hypothetical protein M3451_10310, partial [Chloroflexota bacterium]|nr:hypothetical protein [Chloroflexota bacterium]
MRKQELLPADAFDAMLRADELEERVEFCDRMPHFSGSAPRTRCVMLLLAPLLLLAGCSRTIVDAEVSAEVRGRIFRAGGAPVPGA